MVLPSFADRHNGFKVVVELYLQAPLRCLEYYGVTNEAHRDVFKFGNDGQSGIDERFLCSEHYTLSLWIYDEDLFHSQSR